MGIVLINKISAGNNVFFKSAPLRKIFTKKNYLTSLVLQLVCHAVKSKHLNKYINPPTLDRHLKSKKP